MENKSIHNLLIPKESIPLPRQWNPRRCPQCGVKMFGMPGGHDAHCMNCGYKDPCCGD